MKMSLVEQLVESINKNIKHYKVELYLARQYKHKYKDDDIPTDEPHEMVPHEMVPHEMLLKDYIFTNLESAEKYQRQLDEEIKKKNKSKETGKIVENFQYFYTIEYLKTVIKPVSVNPKFDDSIIDKN